MLLPIELAGLWFKHFLFSPHCCCQYPCHPPIITKGLEDMGMGFITLTLELHNGAASLAGEPGTAQDMVADYLHCQYEHYQHQQLPLLVTTQLYNIQPVRSPRCGNYNNQSELSGSSVQSIRAQFNSASPLFNFLSTSHSGSQPDAH